MTVEMSDKLEEAFLQQDEERRQETNIAKAVNYLTEENYKIFLNNTCDSLERLTLLEKVYSSKENMERFARNIEPAKLAEIIFLLLTEEQVNIAFENIPTEQLKKVLNCMDEKNLWNFFTQLESVSRKKVLELLQYDRKIALLIHVFWERDSAAYFLEWKEEASLDMTKEIFETLIGREDEEVCPIFPAEKAILVLLFCDDKTFFRICHNMLKRKIRFCYDDVSAINQVAFLRRFQNCEMKKQCLLEKGVKSCDFEIQDFFTQKEIINCYRTSNQDNKKTLMFSVIPMMKAYTTMTRVLYEALEQAEREELLKLFSDNINVEDEYSYISKRLMMIEISHLLEKKKELQGFEKKFIENFVRDLKKNAY